MSVEETHCIRLPAITLFRGQRRGSGACQQLAIGLATFIAACSPSASWKAEENEDLATFNEYVELCRANICQSPFPENRPCMQALEMIEQGRPQVEGKLQTTRYLQLRILFSDTYSDWLEGEAGRSVMSRNFCGKKLEFLNRPSRLRADNE